MTQPPTPSEPTSKLIINGHDGSRGRHDVYHAWPDEHLHQATHGQVFSDAQPGTAAHSAAHLVGSSAPEPTIERWDGIGPEGMGPVEILDGRTGQPIAKLNGA